MLGFLKKVRKAFRKKIRKPIRNYAGRGKKPDVYRVVDGIEATDDRELEHAKWLSENPGKSFREYQAAKVNDRNLNRKNQIQAEDDPIEKAERFIERLVRFGLKKDDVCVDYGCGTLVVGKHIVNYLDADRYWGLDIADVVIKSGRAELGDALFAEKRPNLRVISPRAVDEVAAKAPHILFSLRVMKTVHPDDLGEYLGNICKIIGTSGRALIQSEWSDGETLRYGFRKWAHGISETQDRLSALGFRGIVLKAGNKIQNEGNKPKAQKATRNGFIAIVHASQPDAGLTVD